MANNDGTCGSPAQRKILIVDDEPKICRTLAQHFVFNGYEVRNVLRGEEALSLLGAYHPDVVLLDILMPGIGGIETLKQLQHISPRPKIIILSAADHEEVIQGALQLGADFYMIKPVDFAELEHVINGFLPTHRKHHTPS
ncbi:MAG: response regulator [Candidatus Omnitrophica bacterium]|nr:response regulator [Candidatus Omnitrophota bacterium]